ncbi:haloacid dehalogenase [Candidatus Brocadia pituitae]|nr:haloacid dehalogenase [Candidatus Brocadia pituitae]
MKGHCKNLSNYLKSASIWVAVEAFLASATTITVLPAKVIAKPKEEKTVRIWLEPFTELRAPMLFHMRRNPFASLLKGDVMSARAEGERSMLEIVMATHVGMTTEEFEQIVKEWTATVKHPVTKRLYTEMAK